MERQQCLKFNFGKFKRFASKLECRSVIIELAHWFFSTAARLAVLPVISINVYCDYYGVLASCLSLDSSLGTHARQINLKVSALYRDAVIFSELVF